MIRTKLFLACALAFVVSLTGATAFAQEPTNQITYFTFSAPFELPGGKTLPAGKYVFKIVDSPGNRHIVQVMSEDQKTMHATVLAIPAQRQDPADEPEVRFMEAEADSAPAIRTWWYPGRAIGHEFIYPKDHARRLAARQSEGVLTVSGDATGDEAMRTADLARIGANGQEAAVSASTTAETTTQPAQPRAAQSAETAATAQPTAQSAAPAPSTAATSQKAPTGAQPATSERTTASTTNAQPTTSGADNTARTELPRTASPLPLFALIGLGTLVGAGALRLRR
jgi:hypothetical protein